MEKIRLTSGKDRWGSTEPGRSARSRVMSQSAGVIWMRGGRREQKVETFSCPPFLQSPWAWAATLISRRTDSLLTVSSVIQHVHPL